MRAYPARPGTSRGPSQPSLSGRTTPSRLRFEDEPIDTLLVIPPDGGWGWIIVLVSFVGNIFVDGGAYVFGLFLEDIAESMGSPETHISLANSIMTGCYFLSGPFVAALTNKYGFRIVGITGGITCAAAYIAASETRSIIPFLVVYGGLLGIGMGMVYIPGAVALGFYFERWRPFAAALSACGTSIGILGLPFVIQNLLKPFDWRSKFKLLGITSGVVGILCCLYIPLVPQRATPTNKKRVVFTLTDTVGSATTLPGLYDRRMSRYHNMLYPTNADIHSIHDYSYTLEQPRRMSVTTLKPFGTSHVTPAGSIQIMTPTMAATSTLSSASEETPRRWKWCLDSCCRVVCYCCLARKENITSTRPLYRDDIFYTGSMMNLNEYTEKSRLDYHMSVTRIATAKDYEDDRNPLMIFSEAVRRAFVTMLDCSLFASPSFAIVSLSGFFTVLGLFTPFVYTTQRAIRNGIKKDMAYLLLSVVGISNFVGRFLSGIIATMPCANALYTSAVMLVACGAVVMVSTVSFDETFQICCAAGFGSCIACLASIRSIVLVDLVGLEKLTNAFGLSLMVQGFGTLLGVPIAATLLQIRGKYDATFYFSGGAILLSGLLLIPVHSIAKWEQRKTKNSTPT